MGKWAILNPAGEIYYADLTSEWHAYRQLDTLREHGIGRDTQHQRTYPTLREAGYSVQWINDDDI